MAAVKTPDAIDFINGGDRSAELFAHGAVDDRTYPIGRGIKR